MMRLSLTPGIAAYLRACNVPRRPAPITAARSSGMAVQGHTFRVRKVDHPVALKHKGHAGFQSKEGRAQLSQQLYRCGTDRWTIEAYVLPGLRCFGDYQPGPNHRSPPAKHGVRALDRLNGDNGAVAHRDGLADIELSKLAGDFESEMKIADLSVSGFRSGGNTDGGDPMLNHRH